jgi:UDP-N-acetylglucosamine 4,6-dehydratase
MSGCFVKRTNMTYLITGGTGFLGGFLVKRLLMTENVDEVRVFSRDEYKQSEMARKIDDRRVTYWLGDVRDLERMRLACEGVDVIIHAAAMKRMDTTSHNASEVANVNICGTENVMIAGRKAQRVVFVSSDKAYQPSCIYGASKMIAEGIVLAHENGIAWRFGNFIGSRGSVWDVFMDQRQSGILTVCHPAATRFIISPGDVCSYLLSDVTAGLHFPPDMEAISIMELAQEIAPDAEYRITGLREGEKIHEALSEDYTSDKVYERNKLNHRNGVLAGGEYCCDDCICRKSDL